MIKKNFASAYILICLLTFFHKEAYTQNSSIIKEFNNFFEEQKRIQIISEYEQKQKQDSILLNQTILLPLNDSVNNSTAEVAESSEYNDEIEMIDTGLFVQKVQFPREQLPVKALEQEYDWQKEYLLTNQVAYKNSHVIDSNYKVFGWHPYWMGTAYESYNFSLLSMIAYFSYELDPNTGNYKTIHNWETTALIDSAQAHNTKVLLTITNFGTENNHKFLNNIAAQKQLIRNVITLLKQRNANGINIDFEAIKKEDKEALNNFIIDISSSLKTENKNYIITVAIPPVDFSGIYDFITITSFVDLFVIMGYEYHGSHSVNAGPISPLSSGKKWMALNLERSVDEYIISGIPSKKLLLGLPYYGVEWQTYDLKFPSKVKQFQNFHTYRYIKSLIGNYSCVTDEPSSSKYYAYRDKDNN